VKLKSVKLNSVKYNEYCDSRLIKIEQRSLGKKRFNSG
jgi:hypothetical protein